MKDQDTQDLISMIDASSSKEQEISIEETSIELDNKNTIVNEEQPTKKKIKKNKKPKAKNQVIKESSDISESSNKENPIESATIEKPIELDTKEKEEIKISETVKISKPVLIDRVNEIDFITMSILHSPHVMDKKSQIIKLQNLHPNIKIIKSNYIGRTLNEVKNTKFKVISDIAIRSKKYILYIDQTLGLFKPLKLHNIPNDIDIAYLESNKGNILTDIILVKADLVKSQKDLWVFDRFNTPKTNLTNIINQFKNKGYKVDKLNKYLF
jgi:hypothetical protein